MPDRAIIPLMPAVALGFTAGLIASVLQLTSGPTFILALCAAVIVAIAGTSSVFGCKGETSEKAIVGALRAACAVALMACLFMFMLGFLREGSILQAIIWLPLAGVFGLLMTRLTVRDRRSREQRKSDGEDVEAQEREEHEERNVHHATADEADRDGRLYRESTGFAEERGAKGTGEKAEHAQDDSDDVASDNGNGPREKSTA